MTRLGCTWGTWWPKSLLARRSRQKWSSTCPRAPTSSRSGFAAGHCQTVLRSLCEQRFGYSNRENVPSLRPTTRTLSDAGGQAPLAQSVERFHGKEKVNGSIPLGGSVDTWASGATGETPRAEATGMAV